MALIKCPECSNDISNKAKACPFCGCPIEFVNPLGKVRIKIPGNIVQGWVGLFSSRECYVRDEAGAILWKGQHGENASFEIDKPTNIIIDLGSWGNPVFGTVEPRSKYSLVQDMGIHMLATYRLSEVDNIDSD